MTRHRTGLGVLALIGALVGVTSAVPAGAQLELGGSVPPLIALDVGTPTQFKRLSGGSLYELQVPVRISSSVGETRLSIADGEDFSGAGRGRLHDGLRLVSSPLEVGVGGRAPQLLSAPTDPLLETWGKTLALAPAAIDIIQPLRGGSLSSSKLHKMVLITISSEAP